MADDQQAPQLAGPRPRRGPILGLLIVVAVILAALVLTYFLRNAARLQDCVLSGRSDCSPPPGGSDAS